MDSILEFLRVDWAALARDLFQVAIVLAVAWTANRLLRGLTQRIERLAARRDPAQPSAGEQRGKTIAGLLQSVGRAVLGAATILWILNVFVDITPVLAGAGLAGLAVSFGAQSLVRDVIAGFFILLEDQFGIGDVVRVAGVDGSVEHMTLRTTTLRDFHGVVHVVPNGQIGVVSNLTRLWSRAVVNVGVAYREDVDRVMAVLRAVLREFATDPAWAGDVVGEPTVAGVMRFADSSVELCVWVNVRPGRQWDSERDLRRRIKNRFDAEGIEIPLPQRVIHPVATGAGSSTTPSPTPGTPPSTRDPRPRAARARRRS